MTLEREPATHGGGAPALRQLGGFGLDLALVPVPASAEHLAHDNPALRHERAALHLAGQRVLVGRAFPSWHRSIVSD